MSSDSESDIDNEVEVDLHGLEQDYTKIIGSLDVCLKGLVALKKGYKKDCRDWMVHGSTIGSLVQKSIGPQFGLNMIKFLKGE
jgi:hypothetical protein